MFFQKRSRPAERELALVDAVADLELSYFEFASSPTNSPKQMRSDLIRLITHPHIRHIAFGRGRLNVRHTDTEDTPFDVPWLFLATTHVKINFNHATYVIGEFLVYICRYDSYGDNMPVVLIENVSPVDSIMGGPRRREAEHPLCAHPHVSGLIASFCMANEGRNEINEALADGNIPETFAIIDTALHSFGPNSPYCPIERWPSFTEEVTHVTG